MAKKISSSRPMVLDVLLPPFTESFSIEPSDTTHQWHYEQGNSYLPDRKVTDPLLLVPSLSVQDPETKKVYTPAWDDKDPSPSVYFANVRWMVHDEAKPYIRDFGARGEEITNTTDSATADYVLLPSGTLKVKKNVPEDDPVTLICRAVYIDPRNAGKTHTVMDQIDLVTSRDASVPSPTVEIDQESPIFYNPFIDGYTRTRANDAGSQMTHTFTLKATVRFGDTVVIRPAVMDGSTVVEPAVTSDKYQVRWYALGDGVSTETLIDATEAMTLDGRTLQNTAAKFPCYVSGQGTPTLVVDAMLTEDITIVARVVNTVTGQLYPERCINSLKWEPFKVDATSEAIDGGGVKSSTDSKTFRNIVTLRNRTLDASVVNENFLQEWKFRKASRTNSGGSTPTDSVEDLGCGKEITVSGSKLRQNESSLVYSELSLFGPYVVLTQDGKPVVDADGKVIICRI